MIDVVFYFQVHQPYRLKKLVPGERVSTVKVRAHRAYRELRDTLDAG